MTSDLPATRGRVCITAMTGLLESAAGKLSFVWTHDRSVRSFNRSRRSPARLAIQRHRKVRSCCQGTLEYALLLVRFGLW